MPTSADAADAEPLLLDTSAALAMVNPDHVHHKDVLELVRGHDLGLSGHAELETYSVLTRLPTPRRLAASAALRLLRTNFPHTRHLPATAASTLLDELTDAGVAGGQVYDALIGATARAHDLTLVSCDRRAASTYRALGVRARIV